MGTFCFKAVAVVAVVGAVLTSTVFADTVILRNGEMVENAVIVKIGTDELEYRIGEREAVYSVKKADVLRVNYADGTSDVFQAPAALQLPGNADFTSGERWGTFGLNWLIPGLGSGVIMRDATGAWTQVGLCVGGYVFVIGGAANYSVGMVTIGYIMLTGNFAYNIARSATYKKPQGWALFENSNLNFAVLPDKDGNIMGYMAYNLAF